MACASVTVSPSGAGVFRWTPIAADVGQHAFDFVVSDGGNDTTVTITIDVKSAIGSATSPIFRQPLGTDTTIDLAKSQCVDLNIVIEDQDKNPVQLPADSVIMSVGYHPVPLLQEGKHIHLLGDCRKVGNVRSAIWGAWDIAMKI